VVSSLERRELLILFNDMDGIARAQAGAGKPDSASRTGMPAVRDLASCGVVRLA
jgi:hypothetical protein